MSTQQEALSPASETPSSQVQVGKLTGLWKCLSPLPSMVGNILDPARSKEGSARLLGICKSSLYQMGPEHLREGTLQCACHAEYWGLGHILSTARTLKRWVSRSILSPLQNISFGHQGLPILGLCAGQLSVIRKNYLG